MSGAPDILISPGDFAARHLLAVEPPELLFHYTTIGGAYGILSSDSLWMTKIRYLNDTSELEIGVNTLRELLDDLMQAPRPKDEAELLQTVSRRFESYIGSNICVASFCEHGDLLSQWRWYGEGGRGVSIGVHSRVLRGMAHTRIHLWKCLYDADAHRTLLLALVDRLLEICRAQKSGSGGELSAEQTHYMLERFFVSFLQIAPIIKNPNFAEEREWRLVSWPVELDDDAYGVSVVGDRIMQRYELKFPRDADGWCRAIGKVVVGPTKDPELIGEAIAVLCRKSRFDCPTIAYSSIPFRSS
ncbi:MAG TPA: DUF2971 domain-containing protein [Burkholderiales bacterium]|nr:DUF2971 domain-containing protein [Burkholderiales bacterium]